jgi:tetratricopeptide (TPR) repeat protein
VSDLAAITGFELGALTQMLGELARAGVIAPKAKAARSRTRAPPAPAMPPPPPPRSGPVSVHPRRPSTRAPKVEAPKASEKAAAPAAPADDTCELDAETRTRIDELHAKLPTATLYEMLGVARDAEKKAVKSAFFAFAATLHPDRHFRKKLGPYKQRIHDVFVRLTLAYETLSTNAKRAEYDKKLPPPPAAEPAPPPPRRATVAPKRATVAPKQGPRTSMRPRTSGRPRAPSAVPTAMSAAERREVLAQRLGNFRPKAPGVPTIDENAALRQFFHTRNEKVDGAGRQRARVFIDAAEQALEKNDFVAAAAHFKLALDCCESPDVRSAFEAADVKARARKFEVSLKLAEQAEHDQRWEEAALRYAKAHAARAEPRVAERLANALRHQGGDPRRAVKHAEEAVLAEPQNGAFRLTLAEAYADAGHVPRARTEVERVLAMAPKDPRAKALQGKLAKLKG